jgi:hypothetical protein
MPKNWKKLQVHAGLSALGCMCNLNQPDRYSATFPRSKTFTSRSVARAPNACVTDYPQCLLKAWIAGRYAHHCGERRDIRHYERDTGMAGAWPGGVTKRKIPPHVHYTRHH